MSLFKLKIWHKTLKYIKLKKKFPKNIFLKIMFFFLYGMQIWIKKNFGFLLNFHNFFRLSWLLKFATVLWMRHLWHMNYFTGMKFDRCDIWHMWHMTYDINKQSRKENFFKVMIFFLYGMQIWFFTMKTSYLSLFRKKIVSSYDI